ncbi:putative neutral sphingomyelinase isoform X2 [Gigantopelta aegis]|nr:putative neutral sphingomyelinase isoform X2 [Gigantopelta aegis]
MLGSGCCVFSKFPIRETMYYRFSLNGFAHKIWHGDWYAGKGVGLCKMVIDGLHINLYSSDTHTRYSRNFDEYAAHRVAQSFEISQFIKQTSEACDLVILAGDLNSEPSDLNYKLILTNGNLRDCWIDKEMTYSDAAGNTCALPYNNYTSAADKKEYPFGKRIDYIMYRANPGVKVFVEEASVIMGRILGTPFHYSKHESLKAVLRIEQFSDVVYPVDDQYSERNKHLLEAFELINNGLQQSRLSGDCYLFQSLLQSFLMITFVIMIQNEPQVPPFFQIINYGWTLITAFYFWTGAVVMKTDENSFLGIKLDIANAIAN